MKNNNSLIKTGDVSEFFWLKKPRNVPMFFILILLFQLIVGPVVGMIHELYAQDQDKAAAFAKQIMEAKLDSDAYLAFEGLTDLYFAENKYNEYVELLKSFVEQKKSSAPAVSYYIALARYYQLKYMEEQQLWEEYFNRGNVYREEIPIDLKKAIESLPGRDPLNIYARLMLWKFHKDQDDSLAEQALNDLTNAVTGYASGAENIIPIKDVARELFLSGEKVKAKEIYKIYANKIASSSIADEEIGIAALGFYKEGNLDLAQKLYDIYLERIQKSYAKDKLIPILRDIASLFVYKSDGLSDTDYAEKIFKKIEDVGGKDALGEDFWYLRAFNFEKAKDYNLAKEAYYELTNLYPQGTHTDEAEFKIAVIFTFVLGDIKNGRVYFEKLAAKSKISPQVLSGLYQLGLLYQWEGDSIKATSYYNKLIESVPEGFLETLAAAKKRLYEIQEGKPIDYNLKMFLDVSLKEDYGKSNLLMADLRATVFAKKSSDVNIATNFSSGATGCMSVELLYLWSGNIGKADPSNQQAAFSTQYADSGTMFIGLVVVSPSGVVAKDLSFVDILN